MSDALELVEEMIRKLGPTDWNISWDWENDQFRVTGPDGVIAAKESTLSQALQLALSKKGDVMNEIVGWEMKRPRLRSLDSRDAAGAIMPAFAPTCQFLRLRIKGTPIRISISTTDMERLLQLDAEGAEALQKSDRARGYDAAGYPLEAQDR